MTFPAPVDRLSAETRAAIIAAHGRESASTIAKRLGIKRGTVLSTWSHMRERQRKAKSVAIATLPPRPDRVIGLHGVSLPRLRCLEVGA